MFCIIPSFTIYLCFLSKKEVTHDESELRKHQCFYHSYCCFWRIFLSFWRDCYSINLVANTKKQKCFLDQQGREAVNFNISYSLYMFIASMIVGPFFIRSVFFNRNLSDSYWNFDWLDFDFSLGGVFGLVGLTSLVGFIGLTKLILAILAALKANKGENYTYPLTIKFIK